MKWLVSILALFLIGCSKPNVITRTEYKEVYIPVKCIKAMPKKPSYDFTPAGAKALMRYYKTCEELLRECSDGNDPKS